MTPSTFGREFVPGQPLDERLQRRVASLRAGPVGDFELMAARVFARFTGERVVLQDDGRENGMADIRIEYVTGRVAFGEVWVDIDPDYAGMVSTLSQRGTKLPAELHLQGVERDWSLSVTGKCHIGRLTTLLPALLGGLEASGLTFQIVPTDRALRDSSDERVERLLQLGVERLSSRPAESPQGAVVRLYPSGVSGPPVPVWDPLSRWLDETLSSARLADVRGKLLRTGASERHAFLGLTFSSPGDVYFALDLDSKGLPETTPALPGEITHVWVMAATIPRRCICWSPDGGWIDPMWQWKTD